ncbi:MAG: NAD(P)-dependent oxidoreductase [Myxococcota bacterium]
MRVALYLPNAVPAFRPNAAQLAWLATAIAPHELCPTETETEFLKALPHARAAVVWSFDANWYTLAPELSAVFTPSAGREHIAPDPSSRVGAYHGSFHGRIMAESLLGMLLFMNRRFGAALEHQARGDWDRAAYFGARSLRGQTALLVGYGAIGQHCAALLQSVGMRVHGLRRSGPGAGVERLFAASELLEALPLADHVVSLLPGDASTERFFDANAFSHMKPSAYFYNLGRGLTVDEGALVAALESDHIAGAFLDVVATEPLPSESKLWRTRNLFITPHASAIYAEYLDLYFEELAPLLRAAAT